MKKRALAIITSMVLAVGTAFGQIIFTEEEDYANNRYADENLGVMVPMQNLNIDQYQLEIVPLADGILFLAALGGGYLLKKKKEDRKQK